MSFIGDVELGVTKEAGWFLDHEECERKTQQFNKNSTLVVTAKNGSKYVPMGTAWPTNDGNAKGIAYEDVDVTTGNMPGSVVMSGVVIEDRLAITGADYDLLR